MGQRLPSFSKQLRKFGLDLPFNRNQESEADYLGIIFSNLAGYNIEESYNFMIDNSRMLVADKWGGKNFGISEMLGSWSQHYKSWQNIRFAPILNIKYENFLRKKCLWK